jgi:xanthine dehydrogenase YagR molybdenum-binding subunit
LALPTDFPKPRGPTQEQTDQGTRRPPETRRGDPERALAASDVRVDQTYFIPRENHNPIELHATIAAWEGERLKVWDKTQWVHNTADEMAAVFYIPPETFASSLLLSAAHSAPRCALGPT